jgi:hypothetical protein
MNRNDATEELLRSFEGHDVVTLRAALEDGADAVSEVRGKTPAYWLLGEYTRSDRLKECLESLIRHGATLHDPLLLPVLTDDGQTLRRMLSEKPAMIHHRTCLESAFVSLEGVTLLHVAAEFGCLNASKTLIDCGFDVNARAETDADGCKGHTPIFHTVNSNANRSEPIMRMLLEAGASIDIALRSLVWGKGYEWETVFFDVTPVSFAQMGLLPQVHRSEADIYGNVRRMLEAAGRRMPELCNVPNAYLKK